MWNLLVIDDEPERTEQIADWFRPIGFEVMRAHSGLEGLRQAREQRPDAILLDIKMPGMDGHEVLLRLKRDPLTISIPVIILSFIANEVDELAELTKSGLREGADYVVAKKWGLPALEEVVRRILAPLERSPVIRIGAHELRLGSGCVQLWVDGVKKELTPREATVMAYLNDHRGEVCSLDSILDTLCKPGTGDESLVYKTIGRIRDKIEPCAASPIFILSIKGSGYRLVDGT